ncbi:hypothetical protein EVAR_74082_1 [Eumeta japonica]|uniref:Uncharacterized protein n=1 Tax=Eumeta variegata TaxID=151549 RepID=A0A4C1SZG1_EUMVA|nr:hypothetical protein EVAR_74082_1 [Eumeta japonica]
MVAAVMFVMTPFSVVALVVMVVSAVLVVASFAVLMMVMSSVFVALVEVAALLVSAFVMMSAVVFMESFLSVMIVEVLVLFEFVVFVDTVVSFRVVPLVPVPVLVVAVTVLALVAVVVMVVVAVVVVMVLLMSAVFAVMTLVALMVMVTFVSVMVFVVALVSLVIVTAVVVVMVAVVLVAAAVLVVPATAVPVVVRRGGFQIGLPLLAHVAGRGHGHDCDQTTQHCCAPHCCTIGLQLQNVSCTVDDDFIYLRCRPLGDAINTTSFLYRFEKDEEIGFQNPDINSDFEAAKNCIILFDMLNDVSFTSATGQMFLRKGARERGSEEAFEHASVCLCVSIFISARDIVDRDLPAGAGASAPRAVIGSPNDNVPVVYYLARSLQML